MKNGYRIAISISDASGEEVLESRAYVVGGGGEWTEPRLLSLLPALEAAVLIVLSKTAWGPVPLSRISWGRRIGA